ncbi:MAG: hypothetical protein JWP36_1676, partial [Paucimonas sp.]|nr:hypothetical protein [Paucimonas sp.]
MAPLTQRPLPKGLEAEVQSLIAVLAKQAKTPGDKPALLDLMQALYDKDQAIADLMGNWRSAPQVARLAG